jgi:hypothetical protein|tara:strand:- start:73 stop:327 length:255 start_codon:yes stop_codon:yes gene_type:complete
MSREAVILLHRTGKTLSEYFENKFQDAIYTDLHIYTDEPDAMISLIMMEQEAHDICMQLKPIMAEMAQITIEEALKDLFHHLTS